MWPLNVNSVQGVGKCWPVRRKEPHVERIEQSRGGMVETIIRQKDLQVELACRGVKKNMHCPVRARLLFYASV